MQFARWPGGTSSGMPGPAHCKQVLSFRVRLSDWWVRIRQWLKLADSRINQNPSRNIGASFAVPKKVHLDMVEIYMRRVTKIAAWSGALICILTVLAFLASLFIDEYLGRRIEAGTNHEMQGYQVKLQDCDFNPFGLTVTLKNITLIQKAHPYPPVARIDRLRASVHWTAILRGRMVGDFEVDRPDIRINLNQLKEEASGKVPIQKRGWQDAINAVFPLKINRLTARNGRFIYVDQNPKRPMILTEINMKAENIF
ncbi:MAG: hypothetical protein WAO07_12465 [Desulfobacterales bacterium]